MPIDLPITTWAAITNASLFLALTSWVIIYRRANGIVLGDNDDRVLAKRIRAQGNAAEQIPIALILIGLAELQGSGGWLLGSVAAMFTLGRILHGAYFAYHGLNWRFRFFGMILTLAAQALLIVILLV